LKRFSEFFSRSKFNLFQNVFEKLFSFFLFLFAARKFSSDDYGELITILALSFVIAAFFDFGLPVYFQREVSKSDLKIKSLYKTTLVFYLILFPVYLGICVLYSYFFQSFASYTLFLTVISCAYVSLFVGLLSKISSGFLDFKSQFNFLLISRSVFVAALLIFLLNPDIKIELIGITLFTSYLINFLLLFFHIRKKHFAELSGKINFALLYSAIKISIPLGIIVLVNLLYDRIDVLLISKILNFSDTAKYNVAYGLFKAATLSFSFILVEGFSKISAISNNIGQVKIFLRKYFKLILFISFICSLILFLLPDFLVAFFYSSKYSQSGELLKFLSFALIPLALNNLTGITLNGMGKFNYVLISISAGLLINIVLNILFIPKYGVTAACFVTIITEISILFFESHFLFKALKTHHSSN